MYLSSSVRTSSCVSAATKGTNLSEVNHQAGCGGRAVGMGWTRLLQNSLVVHFQLPVTRVTEMIRVAWFILTDNMRPSRDCCTSV